MKVFSAALAVLFSATLAIAGQYPDKQVQLIVPFPAGASTTVTARAVADAMASHLGTPFVVLNRGGAFGLIGTHDIAKAPPDGYTIGWCNDGPIGTVTAGMRKSGKEPPYDHGSFTPIARIGYVTFVLVVRSSLPVRSAAELVAYAKANPGKLSAASAHPTGTLSVALLNKRRGMGVLDVRYWQQGETSVFQDLLRGDVQFTVSTLYNARPHIESGAVRVLGVLGSVRSSLAPSVPTLVEVGLAEFGGVVGETWGALCGPKGVPAPMVETLRAAANAAIAKPEVVQRLSWAGWAARGSSPEELRTLFANSEQKLRALLDETGTLIYGQ